MSMVLQKKQTLLIEGPASVTLQEGCVTALGANLALGKPIVVRKGKTLPLEAKEDALLKVNVNNNHSPLLVEGSTIPESWNKIIDQIAENTFSSILVLGETDCGKNTFCISLMNRITKEKKRIAIVDGDVGQSDIGPPAAVTLAFAERPVYDLFNLKPNEVVFVGNTNPRGIFERILSGIYGLKEAAQKDVASCLVLNTDGWVSDEGAVNFKLQLISLFSPDLIVAIQRGDELEPILNALEQKGKRTIRLLAPESICPRTSDVRRELREQCYRKFLEDASVKTIPMGWFSLEYTFLSEIEAGATVRDSVSEILNSRVLKCVSTERGLRVVIAKDSKIEPAAIQEAVDSFKVSIRVVCEGEERGLIVALLDKDRRFGGLGVLHSINYQNGTIKLSTPFTEVPAVVQFGRIRLSESGKEIEYTDKFEP